MRRRILVLDDSATSRVALTQALKKQAFEVTAVGELDELDAALGREKPDLILVDVHMPDVYGSDLVPWLRENRRFDRPILLYSNRTAEELQKLADECGADGYIRKTGRPDEVAALVDRFFTGGDA
jgi:DNA-binding response OmpR family regulator